VVELYQDTNGDGVFTPGIDQLISATTTAGGGIYNFTNLAPTTSPTSTYLVVITSSNFVTGGALFQYQNSTPTVGGNSDLNNQDHGTVSGALGSGGFVASTAVSLTVGGEPSNDGDGANGNLTIDFGFYQLSVGDQVWLDSNNNGLLDVGEIRLGGVTVVLYDATGTTPLLTTTTNASGFYSFTGLVSGTYVVGIIPPAFYTSSTGAGQESNPNSNGNNNDNGVVYVGSVIQSNPVNVTPGNTGAQNNTTVVTATGATHNPTVDFGLFIVPTAITLLSFTATPQTNGIMVRWATSSERDTWGFHVWRSADGTRANAVRVTQQLIIGQGRNGGATYQWLDTSAQPNVTYTYWLEEITLNGASHDHGPSNAVRLIVMGANRIYLPLVVR
jgi:hypothetical protein